MNITERFQEYVKVFKRTIFFFLYWFLYFDCDRVTPCDQSFCSSDSDCALFPTGTKATSPVEISRISD